MEKEVKIKVPEGYEIDKENSTFECIKFKPIENKLPNTWEEFCKTHRRIKIGECWITPGSKFDTTTYITGSFRNPEEDKNLLPNKEYAEAMLALCQLIQLRDCYNNGWTPNWGCGDAKYCISFINNQSTTISNACMQRILTFKSKELRDQFLENFKDLIEVAKPLL